LIGTGFRLRKVSQFRNHQSPADFITDRFQSQLLRYTVVFLQVLTSIIYLAAQVISIKITFNSIFGLDPDNIYPVIIIMLLILIFECIGGLNSVAFTDSVQGIIMVFFIFLVPILMSHHFGGWASLDPETYPQPTFYQTPTSDVQWKFWQFGLINFSFFTLPHFIQRIYAVRDLKSLKIGYTVSYNCPFVMLRYSHSQRRNQVHFLATLSHKHAPLSLYYFPICQVLTFAPWLLSLVGIFMGTIGVAMLVDPDSGEPLTPSDPFTAILEALMDLGGFSEVVACIGVTASIAAIMSTADSLIIAISHLVAVEIFYPMIPNTPPSKMAWYGRGASLLSVSLALVVGLAWDEGITDLGKIQFPLTMQVVPPFLIGLFVKNRTSDVHPWCIVAAMASSSIYVIGIYFGYLRDAAKNPVAIDSGITGLVIQVVLIVLLEIGYRFVLKKNKTTPESDDTKKNDDYDPTALLYPDRPSWDVPKMGRFGDNTLSPQLIWKSMNGFYEPMTNMYWSLLMFVTISLTTPLVAPSEPPLNDDGTFLNLPYVIHGLPWWAFKIILLSVIPYVVLLMAVYKIPNDYPIDDETTIAKKGVDVDLVQLTPQEMGRRTSYDEQNVLLYKRRSTIANTMEEMGLNKQEETAAEEAASPHQKRLSNLVYAIDLEKILDDESGENVEAKGDDNGGVDETIDM
jgi:Na+/proline symporter